MTNKGQARCAYKIVAPQIQLVIFWRKDDLLRHRRI